MSEASVDLALRSSARLVVVEAPAGCGKTYRGAQYAGDAVARLSSGLVLILTHTHAACDVFAGRTSGHKDRVEIRTIDSFVCEIAAAYHKSLGIPAEAATWARNVKDGFSKLAARIVVLLDRSSAIAGAIAQRYPVIICDEHQDSNDAQHGLVMACHRAGANLRIFGDPMQRIYGGRTGAERTGDEQRWRDLVERADAVGCLDVPRRWQPNAGQLGEWILAARHALQTGAPIDLTSRLPPGVSCLLAENLSQVSGGYALSRTERRPLDRLVDSSQSLLVLTPHNRTVDALHAFFNRRLLIWEGHTRDSLSTLVEKLRSCNGCPADVVRAAIMFMGNVATGFSPSAYGNVLLREVESGCSAKRRGKPGKLQELGRIILEQPDHKGVSKVLLRISELMKTDQTFRDVKVDYRREFWDAVRLGEFDEPDAGFLEIARRRSNARPSLPAKAITTIHKAKGLECGDVLVIPCDSRSLPDSPAARCRLYVAMSRATRSLTFVASRSNPSPLLVV